MYKPKLSLEMDIMSGQNYWETCLKVFYSILYIVTSLYRIIGFIKSGLKQAQSKLYDLGFTKESTFDSVPLYKSSNNFIQGLYSLLLYLYYYSPPMPYIFCLPISIATVMENKWETNLNSELFPPFSQFVMIQELPYSSDWTLQVGEGDLFILISGPDVTWICFELYFSWM